MKAPLRSPEIFLRVSGLLCHIIANVSHTVTNKFVYIVNDLKLLNHSRIEPPARTCKTAPAIMVNQLSPAKRTR